MTTIERSPARFITYFLYFLLLAIIVAAIYFFIVQQTLQPAPDIPSDVTITSPAPAPVTTDPFFLQLEENFDRDVGAWELSPAGQAVYDRGALVLNDDLYGDFAWAQPHLKFDNFVLDVYARWLGGAIGGAYGVDFRLDEESGDFYSFYLHNDGRYTVGKQINGDWFVVEEQFSPAVQRNGGLNQIRIETLGEQMRFFVNGVYLLDIRNEAIPQGDIRLVARKVDGTERFLAAFDNLTISRYPTRP